MTDTENIRELVHKTKELLQTMARAKTETLKWEEEANSLLIDDINDAMNKIHNDPKDNKLASYMLLLRNIIDSVQDKFDKDLHDMVYTMFAESKDGIMVQSHLSQEVQKKANLGYSQADKIIRDLMDRERIRIIGHTEMGQTLLERTHS